jgi:hypothetical protein
MFRAILVCLNSYRVWHIYSSIRLEHPVSMINIQYELKYEFWSMVKYNRMALPAYSMSEKILSLPFDLTTSIVNYQREEGTAKNRMSLTVVFWARWRVFFASLFILSIGGQSPSHILSISCLLHLTVCATVTTSPILQSQLFFLRIFLRNITCRHRIEWTSERFDIVDTLARTYIEPHRIIREM